VVTASSDKIAVVWDVQHGQPLPECILSEWGFAFAHFGHDGQKVLTAVREGGAAQWLRLPEDRIVSPLTNFWPVSDAKYSPDGQHLVTISGSAKIWDAPSLLLRATLYRKKPNQT
jgi:WD40 repeat protein